MLLDRFRVALLATLPLALVVRANLDSPLTPAPISFTLYLVGASQRPKTVATPGNGVAKLSHGDGPISYTLSVKGLSTVPTSVHLHGPSDSEGTGPVIAELSIDSAFVNGTIAFGEVELKEGTVTLEALKKLMKEGRVYMDVHTAKYPDGEIRGHFR